MTSVFAVLGRFALIILGYCAACLAGSAFIHLLFLGSAGFTADEAPLVVAGSFIFSIPFVALFVAYFAFLPSLAVIIAAELLARRDWLFHALAGGLVGAIIVAMFWGAATPVPGLELPPGEVPMDETLASPRFIGLMVGAGIVAGLAYWLVAGRFSGNWRQSLGAPVPPPSNPAEQ